MKRRGRDSRSLNTEEGEILQDIWQGLQKMEDRIVNLETIMINRDKTEDFERKLS